MAKRQEARKMRGNTRVTDRQGTQLAVRAIVISYLITFVYTQGMTKREEKRGIEWSIIRSWAVIINDPYGG